MNLVGSALAVLAAISLDPKWVTVGLGGALAVSYYFGAWSTMRLLRRYEINIKIREVSGFYAKLFGISMVVGFPLHISQKYLPGGNIGKLTIVLFVCGAGYLLLAHLTRVGEVTGAISLLRNRKR